MSRTLADWFECGLSISTNRPALRIGAREWTYRELHGIALRWAWELRRRGAADGERIGLLSERGEHSYIGMLAISYAGCTPVPLHPRFPAARNLSLLRRSRARVMIADLDGVREAEAYAQSEVPVIQAAELNTCDEGPVPLKEPIRTAAEAYVLYTSGSTGRPKGVPITHANVGALVEAVRGRFDFDATDVFSQTFDHTFDLAMFDMYVSWGAGATLVMTPPLAAANLPRFVAGNGISVWFSVPSVIGIAAGARGLPPGSLPSLRWSLFCGEALAVPDAHSWQRAAPNGTVVNLYGPTELTMACGSYHLRPPGDDSLSELGIVSIGSLFPGLSGMLLGANGRTDEREGELCVTGPQMFDGYIDPEDDEERFIWHEGRRWYRTGDRVKSAAGELFFLGRKDQQVQLQGHRVELTEIDWVVRQSLEVTECVTIARGEGAAQSLATYYSGGCTPEEVLAVLRANLPGFMVPRAVERLDELPRNQNGKVDRGRLARP